MMRTVRFRDPFDSGQWLRNRIDNPYGEAAFAARGDLPPTDSAAAHDHHRATVGKEQKRKHGGMNWWTRHTAVRLE